MKKLIIIGVFIVSVCLSFFAGNYFSNKENMKLREQRCHTMMAFSIDRLDDIKTQYDVDMVETLISHVYAAYEYSDNSKLSSALYDLWNALVFDGKNIVGKENDLISALTDKNAQRIKDVKAKLFCPEIAGLFCRIAGLFCHDSRANLSLKPVCFGIAIS